MPAVKTKAAPTAKRKPQASAKPVSKKKKFYFDKIEADRVCSWIEERCTHPKGELQGEPLILADWARNDVIRPAFGWKREDGYRRYSTVYCEVPRGNAKSTYGTAIGIYLLAGDGENTPEIYCVAGSKEQAEKVFEPAKIMVYQDDELNDMFKVLGNVIEDPETWGYMKHMPAIGALNHGHNASGVIFDELHVQKNHKLYEAFATGKTKRKQPIIFIFTTAGEEGSFAEQIHDYAVKVRDGLVIDDTWLSVIYAADPKDDIFSVKTWKKANPGWNYINHEEFAALANRAKESAFELTSFKRYFLNIWTGVDQVWLPDFRFMRGTDKKGFHPDELLGRKCFVGLDLSSNVDTTACVYLFPPVSPGERWKVVPRIFIPRDSFAERVDRETVQYHQWLQEDLIIITPGENQDYELIREDIREQATRYDIQCIGYDPWHAAETGSILEREGFKVLAYRQSFTWMTEPMKQLETMFNKRMIEHNGHKVLRWQNTCTQIRTKIFGGATSIQPTKKTDRRHRIDAMVALIVALGTSIIWPTIAPVEKPVSTILTKGAIRIKRKR